MRCESSNYYRDFIPAEGITRWLSLNHKSIDSLLMIKGPQTRYRWNLWLTYSLSKDSIGISHTVVSLSTIILSCVNQCKIDESISVNNVN